MILHDYYITWNPKKNILHCEKKLKKNQNTTFLLTYWLVSFLKIVPFGKKNRKRHVLHGMRSHCGIKFLYLVQNVKWLGVIFTYSLLKKKKWKVIVEEKTSTRLIFFPCKILKFKGGRKMTGESTSSVDSARTQA